MLMTRPDCRCLGEATVMTELNHISTWSARNNLRLNANKYREMLIRRSSNFELPPTIAGVKCVTSMKILGVTLNRGVNPGVGGRHPQLLGCGGRGGRGQVSEKV